MKGLWLRLYVGVVNNRKAQNLPDATFKFWVNMLCVAKDRETEGLVPNVDDLAFALRTTRKVVERQLQILREAGLVDTTLAGDEIHDWDELQPRSDGDPTARDRKAKQRGRLKDVTRDNPVTSRVTSEIVTRTEQSRAYKEQSRERVQGEGGGLTGTPGPFEVRAGGLSSIPGVHAARDSLVSAMAALKGETV